jgi:hypothetical protein
MRRFLLSLIVISFGLCGVATAAPQDDFAKSLTGPWGRVDFNWQPYTGVLSKNSCPVAGVRQPSTVGLFGEGGTMWIEPDDKGKLLLHDGGPAPRVLTFARMEAATSAVYREGTVERRLSITGLDRLVEERVPAPAGAPATKYLRCKIKK